MHKNKILNDITLLLARMVMVALFVYSGYGMAGAPTEMARYFGSIGLPLPSLVVWLVVALKFVGGAMIVLGFKTQYAAIALAAFSVAAAIMGHSIITPDGQLQILKDFAVAGGLLALAVAGPGHWSLDASRQPQPG